MNNSHMARSGVAVLMLALVSSLGIGSIPATAATMSAPVTSVSTAPTALPTIDSRDVRDIKLYTKWVLQDIKELDSRFPDPFGMSSRLPLLAGNFDRLLGVSAPPKVKAATYKARVKTLANFARLAAEEFMNDDEMAGAARYTVIRKQTGILLGMINKGLGTTYKLPATSPTATVPSGTGTAPAAGLSARDIEDINLYAGRIIRDIPVLDERLSRGGAMSMLLSMLAGHYTGLLNSAVPTGADPADYKSRCQTLANFAKMAAEEFANGDDLNGSARYAVIRKETIPVLDAINKGLGTTYALP
jgi:hypothetical protein